MEGRRSGCGHATELEPLAEVGLGVVQQATSQPDVGQKAEDVRDPERISAPARLLRRLLEGPAGLLDLSHHEEGVHRVVVADRLLVLEHAHRERLPRLAQGALA